MNILSIIAIILLVINIILAIISLNFHSVIGWGYGLIMFLIFMNRDKLDASDLPSKEKKK